MISGLEAKGCRTQCSRSQRLTGRTRTRPWRSDVRSWGPEFEASFATSRTSSPLSASTGPIRGRSCRRFTHSKTDISSALLFFILVDKLYVGMLFWTCYLNVNSTDASFQYLVFLENVASLFFIKAEELKNSPILLFGFYCYSSFSNLNEPLPSVLNSQRLYFPNVYLYYLTF